MEIEVAKWGSQVPPQSVVAGTWMSGICCLWQPDGTAQGPRPTINLTDKC